MNDGSADPADWLQFYQNMASGRRHQPSQSFADASATAESTAGPTMPISIDVGVAGGSGGKPSRKRPRTSRRAPTTLLNTDTSNFRAMVQRFTGVQSAPYGTAVVPGGGTTLNFGIGFNNPASQPAALPSFEAEETRPNQYQYQYQHLQQQAERFMLPQQTQYQYREEMTGFGAGRNVEDDRHQVVESSREAGLGFPEEFFLDGIGGQVNPRQSAENSRSSGYFLWEGK